MTIDKGFFRCNEDKYCTTEDFIPRCNSLLKRENDNKHWCLKYRNTVETVENCGFERTRRIKKCYACLKTDMASTDLFFDRLSCGKTDINDIVMDIGHKVLSDIIYSLNDLDIDRLFKIATDETLSHIIKIVDDRAVERIVKKLDFKRLRKILKSIKERK
jgi:hypothetical protein